jgi:hypothetical protein
MGGEGVTVPSVLDIGPLRNPRRPSGYRGVYYHRTNRDGVPVWVGKVKLAGELRGLPEARSVDPRDCARAVARWYEDTFGADWPAILKRRLHERPWRVWRSERWDGWLGLVSVFGEPEVVRRVLKRGIRPWKRANPTVFATKAAAEEGVRAFVRAVCGVCAGAALFRAPAARPRKAKKTKAALAP